MKKLLIGLLVMTSITAEAKTIDVFKACFVSGFGNMLQWVSVEDGTQILNGCPLFISDVSSRNSFTINYLETGDSENCLYGKFRCEKKSK